MPPDMGLGIGKAARQNLLDEAERKVPQGPFRGKLLGPDDKFLERYREENLKKVSMPYVYRILKMMRPFYLQAFLALLTMILINIVGVALPLAIRVLLDTVLPARDIFMLNIIILGLLAVVLFRWLFQFIGGYLVSYCGERLVNTVRTKVHARLQQQPVSYLDNVQAGGAISRIIGDVQSIRNLIFGGLLNLISSIVYLFVITGILLFVNWKLMLISGVFLPVFAATFMKIRKHLRPAWRDIREENAKLTARVGEVFGGARVVKSFHRERSEDTNFFRHQNVILRKSLRVHVLHTLLHSAAQLVSTLGILTLLWVGGREVSNGNLTMGELVSFYALLGMMFQPLLQAVMVYNQFQQAMASVERVFEVLDRDPEIKSKDDAIPVPALRGEVEFRNVCFRYDEGNDKPTIQDMSFFVKPGEMVALVGPSGAGKTTVANLLARFYDVTSGSIFVDGNDLRDINLEEYRRNVALVLQDNFLFYGSLRENIAYARPDASDEEIRAAVKAANCLDFIEEAPRGLDTQVGERGLQISGGQRQRIAIARAIIADPSILILDEATSALDSRSEFLIQDALEKLMKGRTTFVIAHRLSTITNADKIIVLEKGEIVEAGPIDELLSRRGAFYTMFMEQYGRVTLTDELVRNLNRRGRLHVREEEEEAEPAVAH
ncbi:MAG: ABC transporter ATP-binding protein [Planctomycetes bacterium]|nr:ABC transporter ATP-binding protein [Planctomycetota bacterium]